MLPDMLLKDPSGGFYRLSRMWEVERAEEEKSRETISGVGAEVQIWGSSCGTQGRWGTRFELKGGGSAGRTL